MKDLECGYCKRVQKNKGGNTAYKCKRHRKKMVISKTSLFTEEQLKEKISKARQEERKARDKVWNNKIEKALLDVIADCNTRSGLEWIGKINSKLEEQNEKRNR